MDILMIVMIFTLVLLAGIIAFMFIQLFTYKHRVQIREVINGRKRIKNYKAKDYKDKDGGVYWKLLGEKKDSCLLEVPPNESIEIDNKGKFYVIAYRSSTGDIIFSQDKTNSFDNIMDFQPLTSTQRVMLFNQYKKGAERRGKAWTDNLPMIVVGVQVLILIILLAVFIEDVAKPFITAKELQLQQQEISLEQTQILQEMKQDIQRIESNSANGEASGGVPN